MVLPEYALLEGELSRKQYTSLLEDLKRLASEGAEYSGTALCALRGNRASSPRLLDFSSVTFISDDVDIAAAMALR